MCHVGCAAAAAAATSGPAPQQRTSSMHQAAACSSLIYIYTIQREMNMTGRDAINKRHHRNGIQQRSKHTLCVCVCVFIYI